MKIVSLRREAVTFAPPAVKTALGVNLPAMPSQRLDRSRLTSDKLLAIFCAASLRAVGLVISTSQRSDRALDRIGVDFDAAVIEK